MCCITRRNISINLSMQYQHHLHASQQHALQPSQIPMNTSSVEVPVPYTPDPVSTEADTAAAKRVPDTMGLMRVSVKLVKCEERVRLLVRMRQMKVSVNQVKSVVRNVEKMLGKGFEGRDLECPKVANELMNAKISDARREEDEEIEEGGSFEC